MIPKSSTSGHSQIWNILTLLLPVAFVLVASFESWRIMAIISGIVAILWALRIYRQYKIQQAAEINNNFYLLIQENQGKITVLDLAMKAQIPGNLAQEFLDKKSQEFGADFEVSDRGAIIYHFPIAEAINTPSVFMLPSLNQTDLAKRLDVHPNTISKRKVKPDFILWSSQKDPDSIPWEYSPDVKKFYPLAQIPQPDQPEKN